MSYQSIRNATAAQEHKAGFQSLWDHPMTRRLVKTLRYPRKTIFSSFYMVYLSDEINKPHWCLSLLQIQSCTMTQGLLAAPFPVNVLSSPLCLPLLGKVPFTLWRWLWTMGQIPWAIFCCFPNSGKPLSVLVILGADCKLWMMDVAVVLLQKPPLALCESEEPDGGEGVFAFQFWPPGLCGGLRFHRCCWTL